MTSRELNTHPDDVREMLEEAYWDGFIAADDGLPPEFRRSKHDVIRPEDDPDQLTLF